MKYIFSGEPSTVEKVIRENRIRVQRGVINFTPVEPGTACELCEESFKKENATLKERIAELKNELAKMTESADEAEPTTGDVMDDKAIDDEDLQEIDLDADDKYISADDTKDVSEDDIKEATTAKSPKKRTKKSE